MVDGHTIWTDVRMTDNRGPCKHMDNFKVDLKDQAAEQFKDNSSRNLGPNDLKA